MDITLLPGTELYHGTDAYESFQIPDGPAWFAFDWSSAAQWAGWGSKARGERRVITALLRESVTLQDVISLRSWRNLCYRLCKDEDASPWEMAKAFSERKMAGWYGRAEVMLVDTAILRHAESLKVPDEIRPHGR